MPPWFNVALPTIAGICNTHLARRAAMDLPQTPPCPPPRPFSCLTPARLSAGEPERVGAGSLRHRLGVGFSVASALCGPGPNIGVLIGARAAAGVVEHCSGLDLSPSSRPRSSATTRPRANRRVGRGAGVGWPGGRPRFSVGLGSSGRRMAVDLLDQPAARSGWWSCVLRIPVYPSISSAHGHVSM